MPEAESLVSPQLDENDVRKITVTHAFGTVKRITLAPFIFLLPLATHRVTIEAENTSFHVQKEVRSL